MRHSRAAQSAHSGRQVFGAVAALAAPYSSPLSHTAQRRSRSLFKPAICAPSTRLLPSSSAACARQRASSRARAWRPPAGTPAGRKACGRNVSATSRLSNNSATAQGALARDRMPDYFFFVLLILQVLSLLECDSSCKAPPARSWAARRPAVGPECTDRRAAYRC